MMHLQQNLCGREERENIEKKWQKGMGVRGKN